MAFVPQVHPEGNSWGRCCEGPFESYLVDEPIHFTTIKEKSNGHAKIDQISFPVSDMGMVFWIPKSHIVLDLATRSARVVPVDVAKPITEPKHRAVLGL